MSMNKETRKELEAMKQRTDELLAEPETVEPWLPAGAWAVNGLGKIIKVSCSLREEYIENFNIHHTKQIAEKANKMLLPSRIIAAYKLAYCPEVEFVKGKKNFFVIFNHETDEWVIDYTYCFEHKTIHYMTEEVCEQFIADVNSGRIAL